MESLAHWDFAETFSGLEIALLMIGCDPAEAGELEMKKATPAYKRISNAYLSAILDQDGIFSSTNDEKMSLRSKLLNWYLKHSLDQEVLLMDEKSLSFESQRFDRVTIAEWINNCSLTSKYKFEQNPGTPLQYWERVLKVVENHKGNKAAAGRELNITPTRISQILKSLEKHKSKANPLLNKTERPSASLWPPSVDKGSK